MDKHSASSESTRNDLPEDWVNKEMIKGRRRNM
jgi:hypothetical protein